MENINELIQAERKSRPNYLIEENPSAKDNYTIIYFSSNGIFGDKDLEMFKEKIIKKNIFEFYKNRIEIGKKHIFMRDLTSQWYQNGINEDMNSVPQMLEFLKAETKGSKIITIGSSAGGYAAVLFGILLGAEHIFSFCGQFALMEHFEFNAMDEKCDENYASLLGLLNKSDIPVYYMFSEHPSDLYQYELVKTSKCIYPLKIKSKTHGVPVTNKTLMTIINSKSAKLNKIYTHPDKAISEIVFLLKHFGLFKMLYRVWEKNTACFWGKYKLKKY